jgi:hypothetical protein
MSSGPLQFGTSELLVDPSSRRPAFALDGVLIGALARDEVAANPLTNTSPPAVGNFIERKGPTDW